MCTVQIPFLAQLLGSLLTQGLDCAFNKLEAKFFNADSHVVETARDNKLCFYFQFLVY